MSTVLIIEDEQVAFRRLQRLLEEVYDSELEVVGHCTGLDDAVDFLNANGQPDLILLDIQLNDGLGLDLYERVDVQCSVIFTTAFDQYAVDAFRKNAVDYLLKPIKKEELREAVERALNRNTQPPASQVYQATAYRSRFLIRFGSRLFAIKTEDIAYIYSENKLSFFILRNGKRIPSDTKLQELEDQLNPEEFFRVNRQFIVHFDSIHEMSAYSKSRIKILLDPPAPSDVVVSTETTRVFKEWLSR